MVSVEASETAEVACLPVEILAPREGGQVRHDVRVIDDGELRKLAQRLCEVDGMIEVVLGGSRARGEHTQESDFDLGLYYRPRLDIDALQDLARDVAGPEARVSRPGEWGPWVDGGGWLHIGGTAVDWLYRDLDRVRTSWEDAQAGRCDFHFQVGHPLGVPDFMYAGEVALGVVRPTRPVRSRRFSRRSGAIHLHSGMLWSLVCGRRPSTSTSPARQSPAGTLPMSLGVCSASLRCVPMRCMGTPDTGSSTRKTLLRPLVGCWGHPAASQSGHRASWPTSAPPQAS